MSVITEAIIAAAIQDTLQAMAEFADDDVTLNDWSILDGDLSAGPFCILTTADDFEARQDTVSQSGTITIPVILYVRFTEWSTSLTAFQGLRQAVINAFTDGARAFGDGTDLRRIYNTTPIGYDYGTYVDPEYIETVDPVFIMQSLALEVELF